MSSVGASSDSGVAEASPSPAVGGGDGRGHVMSPEHRRNRKSWSEEEKKDFWRRKKAEKKQRKKAAAAAHQEQLRVEWDALSEEERQRRKEEALVVHERRRASEERHAARSRASLEDPHTPVLVFDLSFAWCMTLPDTKSTVAQIKLSYSALRAAAFPFRPVIATLAGRETHDEAHDAGAQAELLSCLADFEGFRKFPPQVTAQEHWSDVFPIERVVFLTADADEVLEDVELDKVYVVGAFVDHNLHKGLSRAAAERHGARMARLPIKESIDLGNRCLVLTINHVVDALVSYAASKAAGEGPDGRGDWSKALEGALPVRRVQQEALGSRKRRRKLASGADSQHSSEDASGATAEAAAAQGASQS